MQNGFSLYLGLDNTAAENMTLLNKAHAAGLNRIFTSLQIPETNITQLQNELQSLLKQAHALNMEIISDVAPTTLKMLNMTDFNPNSFKKLGITTIRLDDGFTTDDIVKLSHNKAGIALQLNASTVDENLLTELQQKGANFNNISALHNFYPRPETGLSRQFMLAQNNLLHRFNIKVGAFIPSCAGRRRSPLKAGLPTLEEHRNTNVLVASYDLLALQNDAIFLADALPTDDEIKQLGSIKSDTIMLPAKLLTTNATIKKLLTQTFSTRPDVARDVIRATESRAVLKSLNTTIEPENTTKRQIGAVTIDNINYGRYMGELQIIRQSLAADLKTNVVAQVDDNFLPLLATIGPRQKFCLQLHD